MTTSIKNAARNLADLELEKTIIIPTQNSGELVAKINGKMFANVYINDRMSVITKEYVFYLEEMFIELGYKIVNTPEIANTLTCNFIIKDTNIMKFSAAIKIFDGSHLLLEKIEINHGWGTAINPKRAISKEVDKVINVVKDELKQYKL